ncbi:hypothetical protein DRP53_01855 [candidate division WOR-3 bacterium]|uniref:Uncharacterized protein n=1 Tax=candidate division WOR-3 bacterium TaxID=2052148 RepID=A0A660SKG1_UNCW3|nr:MAG: hypothetical protein DRP53_01855 [candidate division WOR-3 bacterium]
MLGLVILSFFINQAKIDQAMEYIRLHYHQGIPKASYQKFSLPPIPHFLSHQRELSFGRDDIIIGDEPNETLRITGYFYHLGNIIIINNGVLIVTKSDFHLDGGITIADRGEAWFDSSQVRFHQHYIYHHWIEIYDSGSCTITNTTTDFSGFPLGFAIMDEGRIALNNVTNRDWSTSVLFQHARARLTRITGYTGEWLFGDETHGEFHHTNDLITWYFFPDSSIIDLNFPEGDTIYNFFIDSTLPNISGIGYHVEIDSSVGCQWATIPLSGSRVTIRNSLLRVTGLMFTGGDSNQVSGLVNGLHYDDWILPLGDRYYRLINTTVTTWNLYAYDSTSLHLKNSIFGELGASGFGYAQVENAYCDGSGGHIEAGYWATVFVLLSSISADVISGEHGLLILGHCAMPFGRIWANGASIMVIINTSYPEDPIPSDTAIVFVAAITGPSSGFIPDTIGIVGSAFIDPGPHNPLDFDHYRLYYRAVGDSEWIPVGDSQSVEVRRDTLDYWITNGLKEGDYELRLVVKDDVGDSVEAMRGIRLEPIGVGEPQADRINQSLLIERERERCYRIRGRGEFEIFDATGRIVHRFRSKTIWRAPVSGIFYLRSKDGRQSWKLIVY